LRVLLYTPWKNRWRKPLEDHIRARGHEVKWLTDIDNYICKNRRDEVDWADMVFCNWADEFTRHVSLDKEFKGKLFTYIRAYEVYGDVPRKINWDRVEGVFFCSKFIQDYATVKIHKIKDKPQYLVHNFMDLEDFPFTERQPGRKIAMVCNVNQKKNIPLAIQIAMKLPEDYQIHIAGEFQDEALQLYLAHITHQNNLEKKVFFYGGCPPKEVPGFLKDKQYILSTSIREGSPMNLLEAMAMGIRPVIHNWGGSQFLYPWEYIFNIADEAVSMIVNPGNTYKSKKYRDFVEKNHSVGNIQKISEACGL